MATPVARFRLPPLTEGAASVPVDGAILRPLVASVLAGCAAKEAPEDLQDETLTDSRSHSRTGPLRRPPCRVKNHTPAVVGCR